MRLPSVAASSISPEPAASSPIPQSVRDGVQTCRTCVPVSGLVFHWVRTEVFPLLVSVLWEMSLLPPVRVDQRTDWPSTD